MRRRSQYADPRRVAQNRPLGHRVPRAIRVFPCTTRATQLDFGHLSHNCLQWRKVAYPTFILSSGGFYQAGRSRDKASSRKLAHDFDFAQFIKIALLLCSQWTFGMCDRRACNFSRGARNREVAETPEDRRARARNLRQALHRNEKRLQSDFAEGHGMARSL